MFEVDIDQKTIMRFGEQWNYFKEMLHYMFSGDGFGDLMRQVRGR